MLKNVSGLTDKEVEESKKKFGTNQIAHVKKDSFLKQFIATLGDPIIRILLIALGIKLVFLMKDFDWYETIGIVIAIFLASFISTISEYGSEKAFEKLQYESSKIKCRVKRNGVIVEVNIDDIVVNDIVILESGDKVPADGIIIFGKVGVDESSLNGESKESNKEAVTFSVTEKNKVYRSTVVVSNYAEMRVVSVGSNTIYGKLAKEIQESQPISPLKIKLTSLAKIISKIGYLGSFLVSVSYLFSKIIVDNDFQWVKIVETVSNFPLITSYILHALTLSVTIIVVAVPEGCSKL